ncbi:MAG: 30S ribosome-binding factor RbfA [Gammaproteobacteria bacterium]|nr:30S ribosome-binding factor RbfA [Rhodocyclaceae bacterium]MBU3909855.1 30S ribosome-binding factor RbfA [Gammaproteobacteria bacterium]MBU3988159.1 30S ribosome-binding factor RbfA [Gammaproteobacteria bacterium]MBU4003566.1 30S ribosome-binding factor RbfA [Gammaproteobacteria bacterium]MBU4020075.1 30S ribosome-binding factor RbfA [Gammaproteobacteria bacterium]
MVTRQAHGHGFSRSDRVAEQIRRDLTELLRQVKDPRVADVLPLLTITDVEVTSDYTHAKVFYTSLAGAERAKEIAKGLGHAAIFLRRELGRRLRIHHIPELHFTYDASVERGSRLSRLIDETVAADAASDNQEQ